jgi:DNA-binding CsgD family transcriptional regulator
MGERQNVKPDSRQKRARVGKSWQKAGQRKAQVKAPEKAAQGKSQGKSQEKTPEKAPQAYFPFASLKSRVGLWLGFASFLAWADLLLCFEGALRDQTAYGGGLIHDPALLAFTLTATLFLFLAAGLSVTRLSQRLNALFASRSLSCVPILTTAASGTLLTVLTVYLPHAPSWLPMILGIGAGFGFAGTILLWSCFFAKLDLRESLVLIAAACCVQWLPFILLPFMDAVLKIALMAVLPLVSILLLNRHRHFADKQPGDLPAKTSRPSLLGKTSAPTLIRLAAAMFLLALIIQFLWSYFIKILPGVLDPQFFIVVFAIIIVVVTLVTFAALLVMESQRRYRLELIYRATLFFSLCGSAALGIAALHYLMAYAIIYAAYSLIVPTMWMISLGLCFMRRVDSLTVFGCVCGCQCLGFFLGFLTVDILEGIGVANISAQVTPYVAFGAALAFCVVFTMLFPEREMLSLSPLLFGMDNESLGRRCHQVAQEYGLTAREAEMVKLFAQGRDVSYIMKTQFISRNTVNSHRKSIYRKLGIHNQQELLSVIKE